MNRQKWTLALIALVMMGSTVAFLVWLKAHQRLGAPGVKTVATSDGPGLRVELPERVLNYDSTNVPVPQIVTDTLPRDTSYGQRLYWAPDDFQIQLSVVLMGSDRTSHHKPEFCLRGAGWQIDQSDEQTVPMTRPHAYELPVIRKLVSQPVMFRGQPATLRGVYVYWFVADRAISADASGLQRMWRMTKSLLTTGVLQRWAYITCFSVCLPGQEEATFERMKQFIAAAVPEFQLARGEAIARPPPIHQVGGS